MLRKRRKGIRLCNNLILIMRNRILARMNRVLIRLYTDSSSSFTFPVCEREREGLEKKIKEKYQVVE